MSPGSIQQRRYITAREHGHSRADSAAFAEIGMGEAMLIDRELGLGAPAPRKQQATA